MKSISLSLLALATVLSLSPASALQAATLQTDNLVEQIQEPGLTKAERKAAKQAAKEYRRAVKQAAKAIRRAEKRAAKQAPKAAKWAR